MTTSSTGTLHDICRSNSAPHAFAVCNIDNAGIIPAPTPHGMGEMWYTNGEYYQGHFRNGQRHGHGELQYADDRRYSGNFVQDLPHGWCVHAGIKQ